MSELGRATVPCVTGRTHFNRVPPILRNKPAPITAPRTPQLFRISLAVPNRLNDQLGDHCHSRILEFAHDLVEASRHDPDFVRPKCPPFVLFLFDEA
jgi:hypothetical protein